LSLVLSSFLFVVCLQEESVFLNDEHSRLREFIFSECQLSMKRDEQIVYGLLCMIEELSGDEQISCSDTARFSKLGELSLVLDHVSLLRDEGLWEGPFQRTHQETVFFIKRLTPKGHGYLRDAKDLANQMKVINRVVRSFGWLVERIVVPIIVAIVPFFLTSSEIHNPSVQEPVVFITLLEDIDWLPPYEKLCTTNELLSNFEKHDWNEFVVSLPVSE